LHGKAAPMQTGAAVFNSLETEFSGSYPNMSDVIPAYQPTLSS